MCERPIISASSPIERRMHGLDQLEAGDRRARHQRRQPRHQPSGIERMKAVDVLVRIDAVENARRIDLRRQRQLHQNAAHRRIGIERFYQREQLRFAGRGGQMIVERPHADFDHRARFAGDVGLAGRIVADQHDRQSGHDAVRGGQAMRLGFDRSAQRRRDRLAVDDASRHGRSVDVRQDIERDHIADEDDDQKQDDRRNSMPPRLGMKLRIGRSAGSVMR